MKSLIKVYNLNTNEDINNVREAVASNEGVIACEVNISKKEVSVVYDDRGLSLDDIINSIEEKGYSVV
ncbi:heavy-metal-associated domain-containing protein [Clostridium gasigenes]|uniref:Copper chaperone CopZ n=1 Tax=Clostridium gasigenes TaxID=94869 RepID=A0A1H0SFR3_9CLOT|nr:heavy-metal-associated domain-containing protein [Clostridium gasigenes]MBB6625039.1 heavy-metal-associated domain-containing protein [Clostridium gasigenes]MBB6715501.1 heavy-metal-associated domain-containing protein [Clostridium gasigenes]MBU3088938.1 heavy-metal-associated domain-containing protein [Clostridium gasigenes]MBU3104904.1 heavy-metal-associated domain-containing protein [Clostridium gasigenes]MBU3108696.1 heavy-metal-associated domain-containing protein [Clostridium gasigene